MEVSAKNVLYELIKWKKLFYRNTFTEESIKIKREGGLKVNREDPCLAVLYINTVPMLNLSVYRVYSYEMLYGLGKFGTCLLVSSQLTYKEEYKTVFMSF